MNKYLTLLILLSSASVFGQTSYEIKGFSEKYIGILTIEKGYEDALFNKGEISIFNTERNENVIQVFSDEFIFEKDNVLDVGNETLQLPYGSQNIILYQDFNFDGIKDIAVTDGQNNCDQASSFQVYLADDNGFIHSPEFTKLTQDYCGLFEVDDGKETIKTMISKGCCWHEYSEFKVLENIPIAIKIVQVSLNENGITEDCIEEKRVGNQMVQKEYSRIAGSADIIEVYSLSFEDGKKMEVYRAFAFDDFLFYVFVDENDKIELLYTDEFFYEESKLTLTFIHQDATYRIYSKGMTVHTGEKTVDWKAVSVRENGSLSSLSTLSLKNLNKE